MFQELAAGRTTYSIVLSSIASQPASPRKARAASSIVAVGTKDDIAGSPHRLADLMPDAEAFDVEGRDHMLAVGDRTFKKKAIEFLREHPL